MGQNSEIPIQKVRVTTLAHTGTLLSIVLSYRVFPSILAIKILLTEVESLLTATVGNQSIFQERRTSVFKAMKRLHQQGVPKCSCP